MNKPEMVAYRTQDDKIEYTDHVPVNRAERRNLNVKSKKKYIPATLATKSNKKQFSL